MSYEQKFTEYLGELKSGMKAYAIELKEGQNNPLSVLSGGKIQGRGRMICRDRVVYLEAQGCTNSDAIELQV